jgi:hypothetical protein
MSILTENLLWSFIDPQGRFKDGNVPELEHDIVPPNPMEVVIRHTCYHSALSTEMLTA